MPLLPSFPSELSPKIKRALIAKAHDLGPVVIIGQKGLTEAIVIETDQALKDHELIKIRINASSAEERLSMAESLSEKLTAHCLKMIGHIAIFYREREKGVKKGVKS